MAGGGGPKLMVETAKALDAAAKDIGIDYIAGYSALVHKGISKGDAAYIESLPDAIVATERLCCSINVASTRAGINMDAIGLMGHTILEMAHRTADADGVGCARFVVFSNAVEDNPFIAGAMHGVANPQAVLNVGISGPGVVHSALERLMQNPPPNMDLGNIADVIKRMAFKCTRLANSWAELWRSAWGVDYGVVDLSLAPTPAEGDSVADILQTMGLERVGGHGSTAALMLLTDAVKKVMAPWPRVMWADYPAHSSQSVKTRE